MKIFGKELKFNDQNIYHEGKKPIADDIVFTDGQTFQQKLDNDSLKGPQGDIGESPLFTIGNVTTLEPGQEATVTIRGTRENPILDFGIPKGDGCNCQNNLVGTARSDFAVL